MPQTHASPTERIQAREDRLEMAAKVLEALGADAHDLQSLAQRAEYERAPTYAEAVPRYLESLIPTTAQSYGTALRRYLEHFPDSTIIELTVDRHEAFIRRQAQGRSRAGHLSNSVIESMQTAIKGLETWASQQEEWSFRPRLTDLKVQVERDVEARIPLSEEQLADVMTMLPALHRDPFSITVGLRAFRELAIRRQSTFSLSISDLTLGELPVDRLLDLDYRPDLDVVVRVWMEKTRRYNTLRCSRPLAAGLLMLHARDPKEPKLFKQLTGTPLHANYWHNAFSKLDGVRPWAAELDFGPHYIRHTTLTDVERIAGSSVARRYAGHTPSRYETTSLYTKATRAEVFEVQRYLWGP